MSSSSTYSLSIQCVSIDKKENLQLQIHPIGYSEHF